MTIHPDSSDSRLRQIAVLMVWLVFGAYVASAQHTNVMVGNGNDPNEPSICLDPNHPNRMVAGANLNNVYYSVDTGHTWIHNLMTSPYGVWGDPTISVDTAGNFYFLHLSNPPSGGSWIDRIVIQKSTDMGATWSPGAFTGLDNGKAQDKHWISIDRKTNKMYITWTEFDVYGVSDPQDSSRILFSRSIDGGITWSPAQRLNTVSGDCLDSDNTTEGAVPCIGPNGEVYVAWAGPEGLLFDRSTDNGVTWLSKEIKIGDFPGGWDYVIPGLGRCNGLPVLQCDLSGGPNHGALYLNWTDQRNGIYDTDVWMAKSTDGGDTWSQPIRVNNDAPGHQQFMTWMTVDQATGWLWFVFYDRRNYTNAQTDVYMAVSKDGGATFLNFKVSESPFKPNSTQFFGDYTNITAHNNIVRPIWTRMDSQQTSVWTALVNVGALQLTTEQSPDGNVDLDPSFPNPGTGEIWVPFKIRSHTLVTMQVNDQEGHLIHTVFADRPYEYGKYTERVNLREFGVASGSYVVTVSADGKVLGKRVVVLNP
jgi:hypothetical protein